MNLEGDKMSKRQKKVNRELVFKFFSSNFKQFLRETTLHGVRFLGEATLTLWEKAFFLASVISAVTITIHLISYFYAKWTTTPVIIGVNPSPKFIGETPFPAITICNTNLLMASKVGSYNKNSIEAELIDMLCTDSETDTQRTSWKYGYENSNISAADFFVQHSQPCSQMLIFCQMSSTPQDCNELFREVLIDDGLCCVFNIVHPTFRYKYDYKLIRDYTTDGVIPIDWNPERGYPKTLPHKFYPQVAPGTGTSMGLTIILNADLKEYFCSSTNGPGFKISVHNGIETPRVRENGLLVPVGYETRVSLEIDEIEAAPTLRDLRLGVRQCVFYNEVENQMLAYKYYTRLNCEGECQAKYMYARCNCLEFDMPWIYANASMCGPRDRYCINQASREWFGARRSSQSCRRNCLQTCFDIKYKVSAFTSPLGIGNYRYFTQNQNALRNMSKEDIRNNIAIVQFFFREYIYHSNIRNVYIGFTEFLSNIGGVLSLFMGFSVISVAEVIYFALFRPFVVLVMPRLKLLLKSTTARNSIASKIHPQEIWHDADHPVQQQHQHQHHQSNPRKLQEFHGNNRISTISFYPNQIPDDDHLKMKTEHYDLLKYKKPILLGYPNDP